MQIQSCDRSHIALRACDSPPFLLSLRYSPLTVAESSPGRSGAFLAGAAGGEGGGEAPAVL
jgi:hypothetical protein